MSMRPAFVLALPLTLSVCDTAPDAAIETDRISCDTQSLPIRTTPRVDTSYTTCTEHPVARPHPDAWR